MKKTTERKQFKYKKGKNEIINEGNKQYRNLEVNQYVSYISSSMNNMAHNKKLDKVPHQAETSLSCALRTVLVIVYENDPQFS